MKFAMHRSLRIWLGVLLVAFGSLPAVPAEQGIPDPYASVQVEHDSNVFRLNNAESADLPPGSGLGDTYERYIIGAKDSYDFDQQHLTANIEGRKFNYDHFGFLDHYEYQGDLALNWRLASLLSGLLSFHLEHFAAPFADRDSIAILEIDTDRKIIANANYLFTPDWRLNSGVVYHSLEAPLQDYPDFALHEVDSHLGLDYLGLKHLTYGINFDHISGNFSYGVGVGPYSQNTGVFKATYVLNGFSSLHGDLGYTRRDQSGALNDTGGVTWDIGYTRQLTPKTSFTVQGSRTVNGYIAGGSTEVDTTATGALTWNATYKISVVATGGYTRSSFVGQAIPIPNEPTIEAASRKDHSPVGSLNILYSLTRQLQLKGFVTRQTRDSTVDFFSFNDTLYGIQLIGQLYPGR
jgi:hypothetical protein